MDDPGDDHRQHCDGVEVSVSSCCTVSGEEEEEVCAVIGSFDAVLLSNPTEKETSGSRSTCADEGSAEFTNGGRSGGEARRKFRP